MSGETGESISGWTVDTLHSHVAVQLRLMQEQMGRQWEQERRATDIALRAHDEALKVAAVTSEKAVNAALAAQKEAVQVAQAAADQRAASMNEWRQSLDDVLTKAMPRKEAEASTGRLVDSVHEVRLELRGVVARAEYDAARAHDAERINDLATRVTQAETAARTAQAGKASIIAFVTIAVAVLGLIIVAANAILR